jgi:hypothetical protein
LKNLGVNENESCYSNVVVVILLCHCGRDRSRPVTTAYF